MLVFILISSIVLLWYLQFRWNRRRINYLATQVPGPKPWPIIGNTLELMLDPRNAFDTAMRIFDLYSDIGKYWFGHRLLYSVHKPEYLEIILNSQHALSKCYIYKIFEPLLGLGLITAPVPIWKRHRKIIGPTFNIRTLQAGVDTINEESINLVGELLKHSEKGFFDVCHYTHKCAFDIFCSTSMGLKPTGSRLCKCLARLVEMAGLRLVDPRYHFDFTFNLSQKKRESELLIREFNQVTEKLVQERKKLCEENGKSRIFLDMLLEPSSEDKKLTDAELRDEVNTFVAAATDTTSQTCSFLMILLGMHPDIQEKVYAEVLEVVGDEDSPILWEHLSQLKYTEKVIKETLRIFPPVAGFIRDTTDEIPLGDGIILASGSPILMCTLHVHRNAKYWPDPLKFNPERFEPEEIAKRHPYTYLPFSAGPRNCPGMRYAMMSLKIIVGSLVRKVKITTKYSSVEDVRLTFTMVLAPIDGYTVAVEKR